MPKIVFTPGLGNQLFQYVVGSVYAKKRNSNLIFSVDRSFQMTRDDIEICKIFRADEVLYESTNLVEQLVIDLYKRAGEPNSKFFPLLFSESEFNSGSFDSGRLVYGFFLNFEWMNFHKNHIHSILKYDTKNYIFLKYYSMLQESRSLGVHVRRGDYMNSNARAYHGVLELEYYLNALKQLGIDGKRIFVFSDDIKFCKTIFASIAAEFVYVDNCNKGDNWVDIVLMSMCDELIIANSTFSWWGAFLGDADRNIVAPKLWFADKNAQSKFNKVHSPEWILI